MKKQLVVLSSFLLFVVGTFAQKDLFTALEEFPDTEFRMYKLNGSDAEGYFMQRQYDDNTVLFKPVIVKNRFGRNAGFELAYTNKNDNTKDYSERYEGLDHYTNPAVTYPGLYKSKSETDYGYLMIDSVIYRVEGLDAMDPSKIDIHYVWIPVLPKGEASEQSKDDSGEKKKMSLKEKAAALKAKAAAFAAGDPFIARQNKKKHGEVIVNYINAMREIQKANPYSSEVKKELEGLAADRVAYDEDVQATNNAYWTSEEGQRKLAEMNKEDITIYNDTQVEFLFCYGSGVSVFLEPGKSHKVSCTGGTITRGTRIPNNNSNLKDTGEVILKRDGSGCGKMLNASGL